MTPTLIVPDLVYTTAGRFEAGLAIECDPGTGTITRIGPAEELAEPVEDGAGGGGCSTPDADLAPGPQIQRLPGRALVPGFVNAHSHAFQRLIRGRTQWRPADDPAADFWSWREAMYAAALSLSADDIFAVSRFCFLEMLHAGITTVGEFHYLHRDPDGDDYADPNELAHRVIAAAEEVGIRISLLKVGYATGGIGEPLGRDQRRFATPTLDGLIADLDALDDRYRDNPLVTVGVAPHSVRAVPREWLRPLHDWAQAHDAPYHIHVSEQPREVEECLAAYDLRPVELLGSEGVVDERLTAVHATHLTPEEVALLGDGRSTVCACPTTERDLGDGFLLGAELLEAGASIALGSDSHTVIDPFEEMRLIEYHERLRRLRRVVINEPGADGRLEVAPRLLQLGTEAGAESLRIPTGRLEPGQLADFFSVDLEHPALAGWDATTLPAILTLSAPPNVVADVWVGGKRRLTDREHEHGAESIEAFQRIAERTAQPSG